MKCTIPKRRIIWAGMVFLVVLTVILSHCTTYSYGSAGACGPTLLVVSLLLAACIWASLAVKLTLPERLTNWVNTGIFFLAPVVSMVMTECLNGIFIYRFTPTVFFANYFLYLAFYFVVYIVTSSYRLSLTLVNTTFFCFGIINYFVTLFRGSPFVPMDLMSAGTGLSVASSYDFTLSPRLIIGGELFLFLTILGVRMGTTRMRPLIRRVLKSVAAVAIAVTAVTFYTTDVFANNGIKPDFWNQLRGYHKTGSVANFVMNTKYLFVSEPSGYDPEEVEDVVTEAAAEYDATHETNTTTEQPVIICIMNETLSDLRVVGDFETNQDYFPYLNSLTENTIRGNLYMSVTGAGTCNSEFEFLTGDTMAFLPAGSSAYELYITAQKASLVSTLASQGYQTAAFHPYYPQGWNRTSVYSMFGFETFQSIYDIISPSIISQYQQNNYNIEVLEELLEENYPGEDILLRKYVSDSYDYEELIRMYEERDTSKPFFVFNVTMQNHGGYTQQYSNFPQTVWLEGMDESYPKVNQYLSLMKKSDEAIQELIEYFSGVDQPVVICMFGDHQPSVENEFYEELYGKSTNSLSTEELQRHYITPYFIWANYDIQEEQLDISANYLSGLLLETAGLDLTDYDKYLAQLRETLPVINAIGYMDRDGNSYDFDEQSEYTALLEEYERVQYNHLFGKDEENTDLFYLN